MQVKTANKEAEDAKRAEEFEKAQEKKRAQWGSDVAPDLELDPKKLKDAMKKEEARCVCLSVGCCPVHALRGIGTL